MGLLSLGVLLAGFAQPTYCQGQVRGVAADFAECQPGSPLQVISVTVGGRDFAMSATVVNISDRTIVGYQLGWVVADKTKRGPGAVFLGPQADTRLRPGESEKAGRQGATFSSTAETLKRAGISSGVVIVGVVAVRMEDGTSWSYPLLYRHQFEEKPDPAMLEKLMPAIRRLDGQRPAASAKKGCPAPTLFSRAVAWLKNAVSLRPVYAGETEVVCDPAPGNAQSGGKRTVSFAELASVRWEAIAGSIATYL